MPNCPHLGVKRHSLHVSSYNLAGKISEDFSAALMRPTCVRTVHGVCALPLGESWDRKRKSVWARRRGNSGGELK